MKLKRLFTRIIVIALLVSSLGIQAFATDTDMDSDNIEETSIGVQTNQEQEIPESVESSNAPNKGKVNGLDVDFATEIQTDQEVLQERARAVEIESNSLPGWPQGPTTDGEAAICMDIDSGAVLYAKNADSSFYPASITKVMTALLALENGNMETDKVAFSQESIDFLEYGDAHIGMKPGEEISLKDAMYGMMLASANEVSYAIGESIGKKIGTGYDDFIGRMNERVAELGGDGTHFENTNGLHSETHYVTARTMALIAAEAYKYDLFREIIKTPQYAIPPTNLETEERIFQQNHKMIYENGQYYYQYCTGGKTGYTDQSKTTLVTYCEKDGLRLVCINLKTHGGANSYADAQNIFEYAFNNFKKAAVSGLEKSTDIARVASESYVVLPASVPFEKLEMTFEQLEKGKPEAVLSYSYNGNPVGTAKATLSEAYLMQQNSDKKQDETPKEKETKKPASKEKMPLWKWVVLILGAIAVAFVVFMIVMIRYAQMKKRRAIEQRRRRRAAERKRRLQEEAEAEARRQRRMEYGRIPKQNPKYNYHQDARRHSEQMRRERTYYQGQKNRPHDR